MRGARVNAPSLIAHRSLSGVHCATCIPRQIPRAVEPHVRPERRDLLDEQFCERLLRPAVFPPEGSRVGGHVERDERLSVVCPGKVSPECPDGGEEGQDACCEQDAYIVAPVAKCCRSDGSVSVNASKFQMAEEDVQGERRLLNSLMLAARCQGHDCGCQDAPVTSHDESEGTK